MLSVQRFGNKSDERVNECVKLGIYQLILQTYCHQLLKRALFVYSNRKTYGKIMRYTIILGFTIRIGEGDLRFEYRRGLLINYYIYFMNNNV